MTTSEEQTMPDVPLALAEAIRIGYERRDRADMQPTIDHFQAVLREFGDHPVALYEVGGAYDTAGQEERAESYYRQALEAGLEGDVLKRCLVQYASTLRNLDRLDESLALLERARDEFPDSVAVRAFHALSLHAAGRSDAAVGALLRLTADLGHGTDAERYAAALRGNGDHLLDLEQQQGDLQDRGHR